MNESQPVAIDATYLNILHPITRRFMFAIDIQRGIVRVRDKGQDAYIDLTTLGWHPEWGCADSIDSARDLR